MIFILHFVISKIIFSLFSAKKSTLNRFLIILFLKIPFLFPYNGKILLLSWIRYFYKVHQLTAIFLHRCVNLKAVNTFYYTPWYQSITNFWNLFFNSAGFLGFVIFFLYLPLYISTFSLGSLLKHFPKKYWVFVSPSSSILRASIIQRTYISFRIHKNNSPGTDMRRGEIIYSLYILSCSTVQYLSTPLI